MANQTTAKTKSIQRFGTFIGSIFFGIVAYTTLTGELQTMINFAGTLNEIGFFIMASLLSVTLAIVTCVE